MKAIITVMMCCLAMVSLLLGQESQLVLTHKTRGHERVIDPGKKVMVFKSDYKKLKGRLIIIDTASIAVKSDTVPLDSILNIEAITKDSRLGGVVMTTIGSAMIIGGAVALSEIDGGSGGSSGGSAGFDFGPSSDAISGGVVLMMIVGAGVTGAGINKLVSGGNHRSEKWNYSIRSIENVVK